MLRNAQDTLKRLHLSAGLTVPWVLPEELEENWTSLIKLLFPRPRTSCRWMDGWMEELDECVDRRIDKWMNARIRETLCNSLTHSFSSSDVCYLILMVWCLFLDFLIILFFFYVLPTALMSHDPVILMTFNLCAHTDEQLQVCGG